MRSGPTFCVGWCERHISARRLRVIETAEESERELAEAFLVRRLENGYGR
jgi:hypothetical protein